MDSPRKRTIRRYIDGYNRLDEQQIRTCLAERVKWTVLGDYQATGSRLAPCSKTPSVSNKSAPRITIRRLTEEGETVVAELLTEVDQTDGSILRLAVSESDGHDGTFKAGLRLLSDSLHFKWYVHFLKVDIE